MNDALPTITQAQRQDHLAWLLDLTSVPTAAGHEHRVAAWIRDWAGARPGVEVSQDAHGNLLLKRTNELGRPRPVYFQAHMDHPAFVVERVTAPGALELSFRGGVMDDYFRGGRVRVECPGGPVRGALAGEIAGAPGPFKRYGATVDASADVRVGDVAVWDLPRAEVIDGIVHAPACDDLAALAAALAAFDVWLGTDATGEDVRLVLTRAEEIGFIGTLGACRDATIPKEARLITLENSRSFADSPVGGGPIVRVGDRLSVFSPTLTSAVARRAEDVAGGPSSVTASQKLSERTAWKWQRKLMAGGACEASVFCAAGYEATCVCLPLGNYHNMADLERVQAGTNTTPPAIAREFIALSDFEGLVDLLVACGRRLPPGAGLGDRFDRLWEERRFVLGEAGRA